MSFQQCRFNFGSEPFKYPPKSRSFDSFNSHAYLKEQDKIVLPRHLFLEQLRKMSVHEDSCTLCFDAKGNVRLEPCKHRWDNRIDFLSSASPLSTKEIYLWKLHLLTISIFQLNIFQGFLYDMCTSVATMPTMSCRDRVNCHGRKWNTNANNWWSIHVTPFAINLSIIIFVYI